MKKVFKGTVLYDLIEDRWIIDTDPNDLFFPEEDLTYDIAQIIRREFNPVVRGTITDVEYKHMTITIEQDE